MVSFSNDDDDDVFVSRYCGVFRVVVFPRENEAL